MASSSACTAPRTTGSATLRWRRARLGIAQHSGDVVIDKSAHVYGARQPNGQLEPWHVVPLVREEAVAGADNPFGGARPRLFHPTRADEPIGFGPLSGTDGVQRAPADHRMPHPTGGEWIVLDGMNGTRVRTTSELPALSVAARLLTARGAAPVPLDCDTIFIDAEALTACLVFRGDVQIDAAHDRVGLASRFVEGGSVSADEGWPALAAPRAAAPAASTVTLSDEVQQMLSASGVGAPFEVARQSATGATTDAASSVSTDGIPGAPWDVVAAPRAAAPLLRASERAARAVDLDDAGALVALESALTKLGLRSDTIQRALTERLRRRDPLGKP